MLYFFISLLGFCAGYLVKSSCDNKKQSIEFVEKYENKFSEYTSFHPGNAPTGLSEDGIKHMEMLKKLEMIRNFCESIGFSKKNSLSSFGFWDKLDFEIFYHERQLRDELGKIVLDGLKKEKKNE